MKRILAALCLLTVLTTPAWAQKITEAPGGQLIYSSMTDDGMFPVAQGGVGYYVKFYDLRTWLESYLAPIGVALDHSDNYAPCTTGAWAHGIDETTGELLWCDDASAEFRLSPVDDTDTSTTRTWSASKIIDYALPKGGGTLTGFVTLHADPSADMHAATKQYVDDQINSVSGYDESNVNITGGTISGVTLLWGALSGNGTRGYLLGVTAGENLAAYDLCAIRNSSGTAKAYKYSAATADSDKLLLAIGVATAAITSGNTGTLLTEGLVRNSGWTIADTDTGKTVYTSATADGGIALTVPAATGDIIQSIGRVVIGESDTIYFRPSMDYGVTP